MSSEEQEEELQKYLRARNMGTIDAYGRQKTPQGDGGGYMGYPSYAAYLAAQQGGGGGGTTVTEKVVETESPFQTSLNTGIAQALSPYYV